MELRRVFVVSFTARGAEEILVSSVSPVERDSCTGEEITDAVFDSAIEGESEMEADERLAFDDLECDVYSDLSEFPDDSDLDGEEVPGCDWWLPRDAMDFKDDLDLDFSLSDLCSRLVLDFSSPLD